MSGDNSIEVALQGDGSGLSNALAQGQSGLLNFKTAVAGAGAALAALAAGGMAVAINSARDFEEALVDIEKVTTPETAAEIGQSIQDMAEEIPIAQKELAGIAEQAGRLGVEGVENIENFTRVTAEIATATDLTAQDAADSFARIATLTEEPIENIRALGDVTNELSNNMGASADEIVDSMTRSAGVLSQLGLQTQEITAINAAMNEVSSSSRIAGTQLRRFGQEIQNPTKVEDFANALGISTDEFKNMRSENPNQLILDLAEAFGEGGETADELRRTLSTTSRQTLAGLSQNIDSVREAQETANTEFEEGGSLAEEFEAANSTFNSELQRTRNQLENIAIVTGEVVLPVVANLLSSISDGIQQFSKFNQETNGMAGALGLAATAVIGIGAAIAALTTGPIALAVGGVAALAAAYSQNFAGIRDSINGFVSNVQTQFESRLGPLLQASRQFWNEWGDEIIMIAGKIETIIGKVVSVITRLGGAAVMNGIDILIGGLTAILQLISGDFTGAFETAADVVASVANRMISLVEDALNAIITGLDRLPDTLTDAVGIDTTQNVSLPRTSQEQVQNAAGGGGNQQVNVSIEGDSDLVKSVSAEVIEDRERRATRNTGGVSNPR